MNSLFRSFFTITLLSLIFAPITQAAPELPTISIVNMIRGNALGHQEDNLLPRLQAQWNSTKDKNIQATWLWQYDALKNPQLTSYAKQKLNDQEFGLFLEIDRNFAQEAGVQYRGRGLWYFSDGLFSVSYDLTERYRLIDTVFNKFKSVFGYYPKTVGAWWVDSPTLNYMQKKYNITSSLRAADQYNLDMYSIWGTPWSISYLPSKNNAGIPADSFEDSSKVVIFQWAPRDPGAGYGNRGENGIYSYQDYEKKKYDNNYFTYLSSIFLKQPLDHVVVGLENDENEKTFTHGGHYENLLDAAVKLRDEKKISIIPQKEYAASFLKSKNVLAPTHYFLTKGYDSDIQTFWYNSPHYRIGIKKIGDDISLIDLRDYSQKYSEEFSLLPNSQIHLRISHKSLIDSATLPLQKRHLAKSNDPLAIKVIGNTLSIYSGKIIIGTFNQDKFSLNNVDHLFPVLEKPFLIPIRNLAFIIFGIYLLACFHIRKNKRIFVANDLILLIPFTFALSFLPQGFNNDITFAFDKKQLFLSPVLQYLPLTPVAKLALLSILPLIVLLISHIFYLLKQTKLTFYLFSLFLFLSSFIYLHLWYFPLDRSTYHQLAAVFGVLGAISIALALGIFVKTKSIRILITIGLLLILLGGILGSVTFLSRARFLITPFELDALTVLANAKRQIFYLTPQDKPIYKAVKPALLEEVSFGQNLVGQKLQRINKIGDSTLLAHSDTPSLIVVPRYLGSDLSEKEAAMYKLKKIFDNFQIAIFALN